MIRILILIIFNILVICILPMIGSLIIWLPLMRRTWSISLMRWIIYTRILWVSILWWLVTMICRRLMIAWFRWLMIILAWTRLPVRIAIILVRPWFICIVRAVRFVLSILIWIITISCSIIIIIFIIWLWTRFILVWIRILIAICPIILVIIRFILTIIGLILTILISRVVVVISRATVWIRVIIWIRTIILSWILIIIFTTVWSIIIWIILILVRWIWIILIRIRRLRCILLSSVDGSLLLLSFVVLSVLFWLLLFWFESLVWVVSDWGGLFELSAAKLTDLEMMCLILMQIQVTLIYVLTFSASKVTSYYYFFTKLSIYKVIKECIDICLLIKILIFLKFSSNY